MMNRGKKAGSVPGASLHDRAENELGELIIWTYDRVPGAPRGFVRDLRLRWACEEAGLSYAVHTVPFEGRETNHLARKSDALLPRDPRGEAEVIQWMFAALNSIEMVTVPWWFLDISGAKENRLGSWMANRLDQLERVFAEREWLAAGRFTVADLLMADVLRVPRIRASGRRPAADAYVGRMTARASFQKAHADQLAHFAAADASRAR
jgi:glutathione S-transferase